MGQIFRRLRTSEKLRAYVAKLTREHLVLGFMVHDRPLDRARASTPTCAAASRWRWRSPCSRAPTGWPPAGEGQEPWIEAHLETGPRRDGGRAASGARDGPPKLPLRGDELGRRVRPARSASWSRELEAAVYAGEVKDRDQALALVGAAAPRFAAHDRRLRGIRARGAPRRRDGLGDAFEDCHDDDALRLDRPARAHRGGVRLGDGASSTCTSWRSRTPSTPTSGPSSRSTATRSSSCSRRPATWTARRSWSSARS